jgi:hypothetical protein
MASLRGAKRRKRKPERALPAQERPLPQPLDGDWWDAFSRRLAAGIHSYIHTSSCLHSPPSPTACCPPDLSPSHARFSCPGSPPRPPVMRANPPAFRIVRVVDSALPDQEDRPEFALLVWRASVVSLNLLWRCSLTRVLSVINLLLLAVIGACAHQTCEVYGGKQPPGGAFQTEAYGNW